MSSSLEMDADEGVQSTNDDAQECKASCVQAGYFKDDFVQCFVRKKVKKPPLINRGYYTRHQCVSTLLGDFKRRCDDAGLGCQVLNLGAGFDTTFWHLKSQGVVFDRFVELDYEEVAARKARAIMTRDALGATLRQGNAVDDSAAGQGCISSAQYTLAPADLRHLEQVKAVLKKGGLEADTPTFILAECVLVYLKPDESNAVVKLLAETFSTSAIAIYEQIQPDTKFGQQMVKNLELRGAPLYGVRGTPTLEAHKERLTAHGFERAAAEDLNEVYRSHVHPRDRMRIEALEMFDEFEEWHLIMAHYCVALGWRDGARVLDGFGFHHHEATAAAALGLKAEAHIVPLPGAAAHASPLRAEETSPAKPPGA